jgi:N-acetylglucosamine malate deacetylase 2
MRRAVRIIAIALAILAGVTGVLLVALLLVARAYVNDGDVPVVASLLGSDRERPHLMAIFPHPDDEITMAGTLRQHDRLGVETSLVVLGRGEAGPTGGLVPQDRLGETRAAEVRRAARVLGVDHVEVFSYPDGGLPGVDPARIKATIRAMIQRHRPAVIVTYDDRVGLYGHHDHRITGQLVREVFVEDRADPAFPVQRLYMTTLSRGMLDAAMRLSPTFRERYPRDPDRQLPAPDVAVRVTDHGAAKYAAMAAYATQWEVFRSLQPFHDVLPSWLYYRWLDREYFSLAEQR